MVCNVTFAKIKQNTHLYYCSVYDVTIDRFLRGEGIFSLWNQMSNCLYWVWRIEFNGAISVWKRGVGGQAYASDWLIPWHVPRAVRTEVISFITYCVKPEVKLRVIVVLRLTINYYCYCCRVWNEISLPPFKFAKQLKLGESVSVSHHFRVS